MEMEFRHPTPDEYREEQLEAQWRRNAAEQAEHWTDERRAALWAFGSDDVGGLVEYQKRALVEQWRTERMLAGKHGRPMRSADTVRAGDAEEFAGEKAMALHWAARIRQAFADGKPCPIHPAPKFRHVLELAIEYAGIPAACVAADACRDSE